MTKPYEDLADRIRGEILDLDRLIVKVLWAWKQCKIKPEEQGVFIDSIALNLHGFYSGLERIFELIVRQVDQNELCGNLWHRELLKQISHEMQDIRPAVISEISLSYLDELRRFRHLVRNVYTFNLAPEKVEPLISSIPQFWPNLQDELLAFADFLEQTGSA